MLYLDTSFIAPLILPEATSERIEKFVCGQKAGEMAVSHWTRIEFAGLIARRVLMRELKEEQGERAITAFNRLLADSFDIFLPALSDYELAIDLLNRHMSGLRSGDALHLAIAGNHRARFITLDKRLLRAAQLMGIAADSGIRLKGA